jgi:hypothetical protein
MNPLQNYRALLLLIFRRVRQWLFMIQHRAEIARILGYVRLDPQAGDLKSVDGMRAAKARAPVRLDLRPRHFP